MADNDGIRCNCPDCLEERLVDAVRDLLSKHDEQPPMVTAADWDAVRDALVLWDNWMNDEAAEPTAEHAADRKVVIEVLGGVASLEHAPDDVEVVIRDYDNDEDEDLDALNDRLSNDEEDDDA